MNPIMKIYVGHSSQFNYQEALYKPLLASPMVKQHDVILPHLTSQAPTPSKQIIVGCDLLIAEVSYPSTGLGIELGWADSAGCKIMCLAKIDAKVSSSLGVITKVVLRYGDTADMLSLISKAIG